MIAKWIPGEFSQGAGVNGKSLRLLPDGWMRLMVGWDRAMNELFHYLGSFQPPNGHYGASVIELSPGF